jgi:hypothetical protein
VGYSILQHYCGANRATLHWSTQCIKSSTNTSQLAWSTQSLSLSHLFSLSRPCSSQQIEAGSAPRAGWWSSAQPLPSVWVSQSGWRRCRLVKTLACSGVASHRLFRVFCSKRYVDSISTSLGLGRRLAHVGSLYLDTNAAVPNAAVCKQLLTMSSSTAVATPTRPRLLSYKTPRA